MQNFQGFSAIAKGGNVFGFYAVMILFPEDGYGIFLVSNNNTDWSVEAFVNGFVGEFLPNQESWKTPLGEINPIDLWENTG